MDSRTPAKNKSIESSVREQYDHLAEIYDRRWHSYISDSLAFLNSHLNLSDDQKVLDVACGTGELERSLLERYPNLKITGVDLSQSMLDMARSKFLDRNNVEFLQASAIELPFADASFDSIVTASAFHYFEQPSIALQEMRRVLKPSGRIIVMDWCRDFWFCQIFDLWLKFTDPAHKGCYSQRELRSFLNDAGFDLCAEHRARLPPLWGMMISIATRG